MCKEEQEEPSSPTGLLTGGRRGGAARQVDLGTAAQTMMRSITALESIGKSEDPRLLAAMDAWLGGKQPSSKVSCNVDSVDAHGCSACRTLL